MLTDFHKVTHHFQYPPSTTMIYSYVESRGGLYEDVCFLDLHYFLKRYPVGQAVTLSKISDAEEHFRFTSHTPFGRDHCYRSCSSRGALHDPLSDPVRGCDKKIGCSREHGAFSAGAGISEFSSGMQSHRFQRRMTT